MKFRTPMNRREFFRVIVIAGLISILNKALGIHNKPPKPHDRLLIMDYDPITRTASVDWASPPVPKDEFIMI